MDGRWLLSESRARHCLEAGSLNPRPIALKPCPGLDSGRQTVKDGRPHRIAGFVRSRACPDCFPITRCSVTVDRAIATRK